MDEMFEGGEAELSLIWFTFRDKDGRVLEYGCDEAENLARMSWGRHSSKPLRIEWQGTCWELSAWLGNPLKEREPLKAVGVTLKLAGHSIICVTDVDGYIEWHLPQGFHPTLRQLFSAEIWVYLSLPGTVGDKEPVLVGA